MVAVFHLTRSYSDGTGILFRGDSLMKGKKPLHIFKFVEQLLFVIHNQADIYWFLVHQKLLTQMKQN